MKKLVMFGILTLVAVLALPANVMAIDLALEGNLQGEVEITLNASSLSNYTMLVGTNIIGYASYNISSTAPWWVTVSDKTGNDGHMTQWNGTAYNTTVQLAAPVLIHNSIGPIVLNSTEQVHWYGEATALETINFEVTQQIEYEDERLPEPDVYRTVIQFVAMNTEAF